MKRATEDTSHNASMRFKCWNERSDSGKSPRSRFISSPTHNSELLQQAASGGIQHLRLLNFITMRTGHYGSCSKPLIMLPYMKTTLLLFVIADWHRVRIWLFETSTQIRESTLLSQSFPLEILHQPSAMTQAKVPRILCQK